jgi:hypothetical protein
MLIGALAPELPKGRSLTPRHCSYSHATFNLRARSRCASLAGTARGLVSEPMRRVRPGVDDPWVRRY